MRVATPDEVTLGVDALRAMTRTRSHLPDRAMTRQLVKQLAVALRIEEQDLLIRLAEHHQRNVAAVSEMFVKERHAN